MGRDFSTSPIQPLGTVRNQINLPYSSLPFALMGHQTKIEKNGKTAN
jgi:hypothetical protein